MIAMIKMDDEAVRMSREIGYSAPACLSMGALAAHVTSASRSWMNRVAWESMSAEAFHFVFVVSEYSEDFLVFGQHLVFE